jgi:hypothetical protein
MITELTGVIADHIAAVNEQGAAGSRNVNPRQPHVVVPRGAAWHG